MSAPRPAKGAALVRLRLSGLAFLLVIASLVWLTVLIYQKTFTPVVHVQLKADRIGNQLSAPADVKIRGLVVGEVRAVHSTGSGATIDLALQPDKVSRIPTNIVARLLPKTLFGEKYVDLVLPADQAPTHLREGSIIPQDQSSTALETEKVLDDLLPLLQSLKPQDLSMTLNALSGALRGRGDRIGSNLVLVDSYLKRLNPELPTLQRDLQGVADLANTTADTAPDLLKVLDNLSADSRNLVTEQRSLDAFLRTTNTFAGSADSILRANAERLIALARDSIPSLELYAKYSPEFPCIAQGLSRYSPIVEKTFGGLQPGLHITLEITKDNGGYTPGQEPRYAETRPPYCNGLPRPKVPGDSLALNDGYRTTGAGEGAPPSASAAASRYLDPTGPAAEQESVATVAAPMLGVPVEQVPDVATVLFGPLAAGSSVGLA